MTAPVTEEQVHAAQAAAHLASLPAYYRARLEREWSPPEPYRIPPERWAELNREWL